jgi:hypothetical protein
MTVDFGNRRKLSDPQPFQMTCEEALRIIELIIKEPDKEGISFAEALFHIRFCESCKYLIKSYETTIDQD